jgi:hypothetical protein
VRELQLWLRQKRKEKHKIVKGMNKKRNKGAEESARRNYQGRSRKSILKGKLKRRS